jgi:hypothetical protein
MDRFLYPVRALLSEFPTLDAFVYTTLFQCIYVFD